MDINEYTKQVKEMKKKLDIYESTHQHYKEIAE